MVDPRQEPAARGSAAGSGAGSAQGPDEAWFFALRIMGTRYAFAASLVTEVVRLGPLTRLPSAPSFLPGVFTHRGEVLPVLDVSQLVGQSPIPIRASTRAALVHCGPWKVAVIADSIEGLVAIPRRSIEPPPGEGSGAAEFLTAVAKDGKGTVAVLDLTRLVEVARARSVPA
jgi:purine-binding chemotaxis protein CheW